LKLAENQCGHKRFSIGKLVRNLSQARRFIECLQVADFVSLPKSDGLEAAWE
jgi:hypothetical protein